MSCPCDEPRLPVPTSLPPGLAQLPFDQPGFPEIRAALLAGIPDHPALRGWRARRADDFGLLLLELWAYVGDALAFYNRLLAGESYLRTARRPAQLGRLTGLLGYQPRPAVAARVELAVQVEGARKIVVPAGTAFRSGAFADQPPQVFESDGETGVSPAGNAWSVIPPRPTRLAGRVAELWLEPGASLARGAVFLLRLADGSSYVRSAREVEPTTGPDGARYVRVEPSAPIELAAPQPLAGAQLLVPSQSAGLYRGARHAGDPPVFHEGAGQTSLLLDSVYRTPAVGEHVLIRRHGRWSHHELVDRDDVQVTVVPASELDVGGQKVTIPAAKTMVTRLTLDGTLELETPLLAALRATTASPLLMRSSGRLDAVAIDTLGRAGLLVDLGNRTSVHFGLVEAGRLTAPAHTRLAPGDAILLRGAPAGLVASRFLLAGSDGRGVATAGQLSADGRRLDLPPSQTWSPDLGLPVHVHANVIRASRGETVPEEILGSGDASLAGQSFTLARAPLTYLPAPSRGNESGLVSTLVVWVSGVRWQERPSFFAAGPDDPIYVVRHDESGKARVLFGDGKRGARLPTGVDNVVARYRFGAGAAAPPAGSIQQLVRPVPGLARVVQPLAAEPGADAEGPESLRESAPRTALLMGRAISLDDMRVVAAGVPGVRAVAVDWRFAARAQRPAVHVWYVGSPGLGADVHARLASLADPSTAFVVERAAPLSTPVSLDLVLDPRRVPAQVLAAVRARLLGDDGLLTVERLGIGAPLYRSRLFRALLEVPGVTGVRAFTFRGRPFREAARSPGAGRYFDIDDRLQLEGTADATT